MYGLWMYVFCSVVVLASLSVRSSSGDVQPLGKGMYIKTEETPLAGVMDSEISKRRSPDNVPELNLHLNLTVRPPPIITDLLLGKDPEEVCFENVGCFSMESPWKSVLRPILAPMDPKKINVSVDFYSRENPTNPVNVNLYPIINLENITFAPEKDTVMIVHGFCSSSRADWVRELKTAYLDAKDVNAFAVNWANGSHLINYLEAVSNTRVVGRELALFIGELINNYGATAKRFHLIGHSLGAQVCSYAAKEIEGIGRLTALDPAQPAFEGFSKEVRLDSSDANFVEVLHTDAKPVVPTLGFGMMAPHGHVDYYFNGGVDQPGCLIPKINISFTDLKSLGTYPVEVLAEYVGCPHTRAYQYFTESLNNSNCTFWGRKTEFPDVFKVAVNFLTNGLFSMTNNKPCTTAECIQVGLDSIDSPLRGSFIVFTGGSQPFCILPNKSKSSHSSIDTIKETTKAIMKALPKLKLF